MSARPRCAIFAFALVLSSAACGGDPPTKEIQQAREAIGQARTAGAAEYAGEELAAAEQALRDADAAVEQRDYRLALNHALDSREHAQTAGTQAAGGKSTAKAAATRAIADATAKLEDARNKFKVAETAHLPSLPSRALVEPRTKLGDAAQMLQEASALAGREEYAGAEEAAGKAAGLANGVLKDIESAPQPAPRRRR